MKNIQRIKYVTSAGLIIALIACCFACSADSQMIALFDAKNGADGVTGQGAAIEMKNGELFVTTGTDNNAPGIVLKGHWSLPESTEMLLVVTNHENRSLTLRCRIVSPHPSDSIRNFSSNNVTLAPGETRQWRFILPMKMPEALKDKFFGMRGNPFAMSNNPFDPSDVTQVILTSNQSREVSMWSVKQIAAKPVKALFLSHVPVEKFFPMIDRYGQYIHADWPGKVKSDADLKKNLESEAKELAAPRRADWSQYGGWSEGPKLEATGHFYPVKRNGVWWLVDPDGYLFWSHGVDCVHTSNADTPTDDREHYFAELPFESFKGRGGWAVHGYYVGKTPYGSYNFTGSNLQLKYGDDWKNLAAEIAHKRLHAWGMNTIANWSDAAIYRLGKTPYTATLNTSGPVIAGSEGYWGQFRDPFHPEFRRNIATAVSRQRDAANDPWCIGFFVDNELGWGNDTSLAVGAMASPATQPAKIAVVGMLREKYDTIEKLNAAWNTSHADWDALLAPTTAPNTRNEAVRADMQAGYSLIAEEYFKVIRDEVKKVSPNKIYFGCRFAWVNDRAVRAADKFCDVLSFNLYQYDVSSFKLPEGVDKAVINGEFHFGALDRGMLHTGLCPTPNQKARAEAYKKYVRSALEHPNFVGTHWFQYGEQATTGRGGDGENYQIGLVDVCDTPYPELIEVVKQIGATMYNIREKK